LDHVKFFIHIRHCHANKLLDLNRRNRHGDIGKYCFTEIKKSTKLCRSRIPVSAPFKNSGGKSSSMQFRTDLLETYENLSHFFPSMQFRKDLLGTYGNSSQFFNTYVTKYRMHAIFTGKLQKRN
jgi:hypothetical protein